MSEQDTTPGTRYSQVSSDKADGATYTPFELADFVATQIVSAAESRLRDKATIRILDPAVGDGELLLRLLQRLRSTHDRIEVHGFDTSAVAVQTSTERLRDAFPNVALNIVNDDFLEFSQKRFEGNQLLFQVAAEHFEPFDLVIANPPYVRTQILGADQAQTLARQFGLTGRVDLYYAFLVAIAGVLRRDGVAGIIVSNRFMTTRAGKAVRAAVRKLFGILHVWDLGDTKIFGAAVLPAVILVQGEVANTAASAPFTSIYETQADAHAVAIDPIRALCCSGTVRVSDGRTFLVKHGTLDLSEPPETLWRVRTEDNDAWLKQVAENTWNPFRAIGKIRVGVKTCADSVFIRTDWDQFHENDRPELLHRLTTHHVAGRFRAVSDPGQQRWIVYPHLWEQGRRTVADLAKFPRSRRYLEGHRAALQKRSYVAQAGRQWYEIWVPQDPNSWPMPKLVFRDITDRPCFWLDFDGTVVNGDCYWIVPDNGTEDLLWLAAAIGNSTFAEVFYDHSFNNKLYAGRRRFITQYVEQFPLPDPSRAITKTIIALAKALYEKADDQQERELDQMVWTAFGVMK